MRVFFFFQAEDGIRDLTVTGVQTCALPISDSQDARGYARAQDETFYRRQRELLARVVAESDVVITAALVPGKDAPVLITADMVTAMAPGSVIEIGRASCRERV